MSDIVRLSPIEILVADGETAEVRLTAEAPKAQVAGSGGPVSVGRRAWFTGQDASAAIPPRGSEAWLPLV
jgi:hypothetical protein